MAEFSLVTPEQLEQKLSQQLIALYQTHLGHQLNNVYCKIVDKTITIVAEDSITGLEQFLLKNNRFELAQQVRSTLHKILDSHVKLLVESVVNVPVVDVICDSVFDTRRTSIVAVLADLPDFASS